MTNLKMTDMQNHIFVRECVLNTHIHTHIQLMVIFGLIMIGGIAMLIAHGVRLEVHTARMIGTAVGVVPANGIVHGVPRREAIVVFPVSKVDER